MAALSCLDSKQNLGVSECKKLPQLIKGMITTPENYTITAALAASAAQWQSDIKLAKNQRIYLWPQWAVNSENISEEQIVEETPLTAIGVRAGQYRFRLLYRENLELHKAMYSHRNSGGRVFLIDNENKIIGTSSDGGTTLKGFLLDSILPEKIMFSDGSNASKTGVNIFLADNEELDLYGVQLDGSSFVNSVLPLTTAVIGIVGTPATDEIIVDVYSKLDNVPVSGLVVADFNLLDGAGAAQSISTVTESSTVEGRYTLAPTTTFASGTIALVAASSLSIDQPFETIASTTVTVA